MVAIVIHRRIVFIVLVKDAASTISKEKFDSFADARDECDRVSWYYPQAQVILMRQEDDAVQTLYKRNPLTKA